MIADLLNALLGFSGAELPEGFKVFYYVFLFVLTMAFIGVFFKFINFFKR